MEHAGDDPISSTWRDHELGRPAYAYGKHKLKPATSNLPLCIAVPCLRRTPHIGKARTAGTGRSRRRSNDLNDLNDLRRKVKSNWTPRKQPKESRTTFPGGSINPRPSVEPPRMQMGPVVLPCTRGTRERNTPERKQPLHQRRATDTGHGVTVLKHALPPQVAICSRIFQGWLAVCLSVTRNRSMN